jgi:hypothetical protein
MWPRNVLSNRRRRATADPSQEPDRHIDRSQRFQQVAGAVDWQVVRAG